MEKLPNDPAILVSAINMFLRDEEFDSLDALCYCYNRDPKELRNYLQNHGFIYDEKQKQFKRVK